jgi:hypothetical protein
MSKLLTTNAFSALLMAFAGTSLWAQSHPGAEFGARDPAVCASRKSPAKGAPTVDQAKTYFSCDSEGFTPFVFGGSGAKLYLVTEVKIEVASSPRPFNILTDVDSAIDPKQPVYNIRGSYAGYWCKTPGAGGGGSYPIGKNCTRSAYSNAGGMCYKDTFADWHCILSTGPPPSEIPDQPAPGR